MRSIALLGLFLALVGASSRPKPITMTVTPQTCLAPCSVRIDLRIQPDPLNRWYLVAVDGPKFRESGGPLDGEHELSTLAPIWFVNLPEGEYVVVAAVYRATTPPSEAGRVTQTVRVG